MGTFFSKWGKWILVIGLVFSVFSVSTAGQATAKETVINKQLQALMFVQLTRLLGKLLVGLRLIQNSKPSQKHQITGIDLVLKGKMATYLGNTSRPQLPHRHQNLQRQKLCK